MPSADFEPPTVARHRAEDAPPAERAPGLRGPSRRTASGSDRVDVASVMLASRVAGNRATATLVLRARAQGQQQVVTADAAAQAIIAWIQTNPPPGQQTNYSVGVATNGDLYISRVGGVTAATTYVTNQLGAYIQQQNYHLGRDIFLAGRFNNAYTSGNHAETCVIAAAGAGALTKIYCAGPHCAFCAALMRKLAIATGAAVGGSDQSGWAHPFAPIFLGSSVNNDTESQLAALEGLAAVPTRDDATAAGISWGFSPPQQSNAVAWL